MIQRRQPQPISRRRGLISMELVLALPLFLLLLLGLFEFSFLLYGRSDVLNAAHAGARLATLHGVQPEDVELEVGRTLRGRLQSSFTVESQLGEFSGDEVVVMVRVPMTAAAPNLLWPLGYNLRGRDLVAEARMLKE